MNKELLRNLVSSALVASGVTALGRMVSKRDGAIIYMGHRVSSENDGYLGGLRPEWFEEQILYLKRHYRFISLSELVRCYKNNVEVPKKSIVLTFDDGFADNYHNAYPILKKHGVPATIFLVTGSIDSGLLPWPQKLGYVIQKTKRATFTFNTAKISTTSELERILSVKKIKTVIRKYPRSEREHFIDELIKVAEVTLPQDRMLTWKMVNEMIQNGIEFGAHTYSHPALADIEEGEARWEMQRSYEDIKKRLNLKDVPFTFPMGSRNGRLVEIAKEIGFSSLFQSNGDQQINNLANSTPHSLVRLGLPDGPATNIESLLDGGLLKLFKLKHKLYKKK